MLALYLVSPVTCLEVVALVVAVLAAIGGYHAFNSSTAAAAPSQCITARAERALSVVGAAVILRRYGVDATRAEDYAESFAGPIDFERVQPKETFLRYYSRGRVGRFLTTTPFTSSIRARLALYLPYGNKATFVQQVNAKQATMVLSGGVRFGKENVEQFLTLQPDCFRFPPGKPVGG